MSPTRFASLAGLCAVFVPCLAGAYNVRTDRPRLLFSGGAIPGISVGDYRTRCTTDPTYSNRCRGGISNADSSLYPAMAHAAGYLVDSDASQCTAAFNQLQTLAADAPGSPDTHSFISNHGRTMADLAVTLDWCYPALDATQRDWIVAKITSYADWYVANGAPDVFHDDMANVWNSVALAGLTLKGTSADSQADGYLAAADTQWKNVILPAMAYAGDWWHEGFTYVQATIGSMVWYATAWSTATDEDVFAYGQAHGDLWEGYLRMHAYAMRPDYRYVYFGDTSDNKQSIELFSRPLVDMITYGTRSALGQGLSDVIHDHSQPGYDYAGANGWLFALLYDASRDSSATQLSSLPTARWMSPGVQDVAVMRSGWGPDDTYVWMSCGDYMSAHQHDEVGAFQIFRHAPLTGSTGYYDDYNTDHWQNYYSQHSVHANTLAVYQPGEFFPTLQSITDPSRNVNDGGERVLGLDRNGSTHQVPDLAAYMTKRTSGPRYETGTLEQFGHSGCYDYVACNATAAYDSPGNTTNGNTAKVNEVTRQLVFLPPDVVVVFDRVEATDATYDKRFLLHTLADPQVSGDAFTVTNGTGRLLGRSLLPATADVNVITNFSVEGTPHPPSTPGIESGGTRLEISPRTESARDYFLHVFRATDSSDTDPLDATVQETAQTATVTVHSFTTHYVITFQKTGPMGGHVLAERSVGTNCDEDFTGSAPPPDGGVSADAGGGTNDAGVRMDGGARPDAGSPRDAGATADGSPAGDAGTTGTSHPGCGCAAPGRENTPRGISALGLAAAAALVSARRRRGRH